MGVYSALRGFVLAHRECGEAPRRRGPAHAGGLSAVGPLLVRGQPGAMGDARRRGGRSAAVDAARV